jgi:histidinol-phosphate aminotransferase
VSEEKDKSKFALVRSAVQSLRAYPVSDASGMIKLDAMENPYQWPDDMIQAWLERIRAVEMNRYPDTKAGALANRIRAAGLAPAGSTLVFGNGSDELIQVIMLAVGGHGRKVLVPVPSFVMYEMIARFTDTEFVGIPLHNDFTLDVEEMIAGVRRHDPALVILSYPNNPSGNLFDRQAIVELISECNGLVVIDEAYHIFSHASFIDDLDEYDNVVVLRTLSKMGLAGLRLGYMAGRREWLTQFDKVRLPFNINVLTQLTAEFALQHYRVFQEQADRICRERMRVERIMDSLDQITPYPSDANFVLFRCDGCDAEEVFQGLLQHQVLIKNLHSPGTALQNCLRATVGKAHENEAFLNALSLLVTTDYSLQ